MSEATQDATHPEAGTGGRICILVVGMHRSGTSALTRMLNLLGCDIARSLVPADRFNERGYWEAPEIAELNDAILAAAGSSWQDWFDAAWIPPERRPQFKAEAIRLLRIHFTRSRLFVIKDPRISRLLPFWREALADLGVDVRVVIAWRDATEVASSLEKRDGVQPARGYLSWLDHVITAENETRDLPRVFVHFPDLLADWRVVVDRIAAKLVLAWPRHPDEARREIDEFLSPSLRHHDCSTEISSACSPWVVEAVTLLNQGPETPEARKRFDALWYEVTQAAAAFGPPLAQLASHGRYLKARLDAAEAEAARLPGLQARLEAEQETVRQRTALAEKLREDLARTGQELKEAQAKAAAVHALFTEASRSLMQRNAELETVRHQLGAIEGSRSWHLTAPYRRAGSWSRQRLRALAPTPLGQRLIRWRNRLRHLLR